MLLSLFLVSTSYSQTMVLNSKGDTLIGFTIPQSKFILKLPAKIKEQSGLLDICKQQSEYKDSVIIADSIIISAQATTIKNNAQQKDITAAMCQNDKNTLKSEIIRQKRQKWLIIGISAAIISAKVYSELKR